MSGVVVHTVSPNGPTKIGSDARAIVGMSKPEGGELWVPTGGKGPAYADYSAWDSIEQVLPLDDTLAERLVSFFEGCLLPNVHMTKTIPGKWDCHSFALWMQGQITDPEAIDLDETEAIENARVQAGVKIKPHALKLGELGIIGGRNKKDAVADHSVIGLDKGRGLQALGRHRPLIIANHERVAQHYRNVSRSKFSDREYGMYTVSRRRSTLMKKLFGSGE
jgi:hypothetical protein